MGTRADFYVGRGEQAEWLGSVAWDGYPGGMPEMLMKAETEDTFRAEVAKMATDRDDFTAPERGWPWPWDTSSTTDYAYAFEDGKVYASGFGNPWFEVDLSQTNGGEPMEKDGDGEIVDVDRTGEPAVFPDMKARQNVRFDSGSGLLILQSQGREA